MRRIFIASFFVITLILVSFFANVITSHAAFYADSSVKTYSSFCGVTGMNAKVEISVSATSTLFDYFRSDSTVGTDNCFTHRVFNLGSVPSTTSYFVRYSINRVSGSCIIGFVRGTSRANFSMNDEKVFTTSTTSALFEYKQSTTISGFGVGIRAKSSLPGDCDFYIQDVYDSTGVQYYSIINSNSLGGSTTTVPLFTPSDTAKLNSMTPINCVYSATSSICTPQTASTTIPITPENLFFLVISFVGSFLLTIFLIRKLT